MSKFAVSKEELERRLTPLEFQVTQKAFTEKAFSGEYNKLEERGTYSCVVCNEDLFQSETKYESSCGWPSFFDSIDKSRFNFKPDFQKAPRIRTEVTCFNCDAHLGHIFDDGPKPTRKRFCINSAALKFRYS